MEGKNIDIKIFKTAIMLMNMWGHELPEEVK